jgi:hypothetical protein
MRKGRRAIYLVVWLLKSLFLRLTPARRVLLALSFVLMWQATDFERHGDTTQISVHFPFFGIVTLLFILMLELKDKLLARDELEAGRAVQLALMPDPSPAIPGWDVWLFTRSGALAAWSTLPPANSVHIVLAMWWGLPAALMASSVDAALAAGRCRELGEENDPLSRRLPIGFDDGLSMWVGRVGCDAERRSLRRSF